MFDTLNGYNYKKLIVSGIKNLKLHIAEVNDLNVFPVPDGDTGTNMVSTLHNGYKAIENNPGELSELSMAYAKAVTFGARGNSGVIVSQFFYGFSKCFFDKVNADCGDFVNALRVGTSYAYKAVANPVEGTVLTVMREASEFVQTKYESGTDNIGEIIELFLEKARVSLARTPELLPVLKAAGVCDSGAAGFVYFFEGVKKYIDGTPLEEAVTETDSSGFVDYSGFDRSSIFTEGYCTEFLLQQLENYDEADEKLFTAELEKLGNSVVTVFEDDKIKVHVHTDYPEKVMAFAHKYGEFLSIKIENMSVQHTLLQSQKKQQGVEILKEERFGDFSVISVTSDDNMKDIFVSMGSDIVIYPHGNVQPAVTDYLKAFESADTGNVLVFPNSKNSTLAALKAKELCGGNAIIFDTKSDAECYAALSMIDFDESDISVVEETVRGVIENIYSVKIIKAVKDSKYGEVLIKDGDYIGVCGDEVLSCSADFSDCCEEVIKTVCRSKDWAVITFFAGDIALSDIENVQAFIDSKYSGIETDAVETNSKNFAALISFE